MPKHNPKHNSTEFIALTNNLESIAWLVLFPDGKCHDGALIFREVVLAPGHHLVRVGRGLVQLLEAGPFQFFGGRIDDVVGIWTGIQVCAALLR